MKMFIALLCLVIAGLEVSSGARIMLKKSVGAQQNSDLFIAPEKVSEPNHSLNISFNENQTGAGTENGSAKAAEVLPLLQLGHSRGVKLHQSVRCKTAGWSKFHRLVHINRLYAKTEGLKPSIMVSRIRRTDKSKSFGSRKFVNSRHGNVPAVYGGRSRGGHMRQQHVTKERILQSTPSPGDGH